MKRILIIQTAFIGDVILATVLIEKFRDLYPEARIDFLVRKGNEELLKNNPNLNTVIVWDKRHRKYVNFLQILSRVRRSHYDLVVNAHRFLTSGLITWLSGAGQKIGFDKNPFSFCYQYKIAHKIADGIHEIDRNLSLIDHLGGNNNYRPKLYFTDRDEQTVKNYIHGNYVTMAPASVWYTKQLPIEKWIELSNQLDPSYEVCLIGGSSDISICEVLVNSSKNKRIANLAGKLTMQETAALMKGAHMNYVNDSAPLHIASSVNAPATVFYCSTVPEFGFGPLSDNSQIVQIDEELSCRPCGLHGFRKCPEGHFDCGKKINVAKAITGT